MLRGASLTTARPLACVRVVYNANDYCDIMEHLIARWNVNARTGLGAEAAEAQVQALALPHPLHHDPLHLGGRARF